MQTQEIKQEVDAIFAKYGSAEKLSGNLPVTTPLTGELIAAVKMDSAETIGPMIERSLVAQRQWKMDRNVRVEFLLFLMKRMSESATDLAKLVHYDSGKSVRESAADVASTIAFIATTIKAASYEALPSGAERSKEYTSLGVVLIIEPFNFFSIKLWTGVPALLAGNTVICKASEHASLSTILFAKIVLQAAREFNVGREGIVPEDVFQVAVGGADVGKSLVADPRIAKVVVTGSIAVCEQVREADNRLAREARALTEGGAANFVIISNSYGEMGQAAYIRFVVGAILRSLLPYAGQKCIGARLLVIHADIKDDFLGELRRQLEGFATSWNVENAFAEENLFEFSPLINLRAGQNFQRALQQTIAQGGELIGGERIGGDQYPNAQYYRPAVGVFLLPVPLMDEEVFGPYLAVVHYTGSVEDALRLAQKPNAKLVNAYYGSDPAAVKVFKRRNEAGFTLINTPQGTGLLPPYGLGFGGNGLSGQGESLARDPELIFVKQSGDIRRFVTFPLPATS